MELGKRAAKFTGVVLAVIGSAATLIFGLTQDGTFRLALVGISLIFLTFFVYIGVVLTARLVDKLKRVSVSYQHCCAGEGRPQGTG